MAYGRGCSALGLWNKVSPWVGILPVNRLCVERTLFSGLFRSVVLESSSRSMLASRGQITLYSLLSESSKRKLFSQLFPRADRAIISRPKAIFRGEGGS